MSCTDRRREMRIGLGSPGLVLSAAVYVAAALACSQSEAAEPISDIFDGAYGGQGQLLAHLSDPGCSVGLAYFGSIAGGGLHAESTTGSDVIRGIVTRRGFVTGSYTFADGRETAYEGLIEGRALVAGVTSPGGQCTWLIKLQRQ